jgi:ArsR family transcriptional regulator
MDAELKALDRVFKALADPTRLRILALLQDQDVCVCHIHDSLKISQPKASRHLAYLRKAGVVSAERRGLWVHYRMAPQVSRVAQAVLDTAKHCVTHTPAAKKDLARFEAKTGCCVSVGEPAVAACCGDTERNGRL